MSGSPRRPLSRAACLLALAALAALLTSCTSTVTGDPNAAFCNHIREATGPLGAETTFAAGDPKRLEETINDLRELAEVAPDEVDATTQRMVEIFEAIRQTPRDDVRNALAEGEGEIIQLSNKLTQFTLDNCGVILQRAPATPTPVPEIITVTE